MNTCQWYDEQDGNCTSQCEGRTIYCGTHNRMNRKHEENTRKELEKRELQLSKKREPRATPTRDPKKWKNTFLCSDGTKVTQAEIDENLKAAYAEKYKEGMPECEGCGNWCDSSAHVIPKARCKQIGKTELIWHQDNFFPADWKCNGAIENPKGQEWKKLLNLDKCMWFIYENDKELFQKFAVNGFTFSNLAIKTGETI